MKAFHPHIWCLQIGELLADVVAEGLVPIAVALKVLRAGAAQKPTAAARADSLRCMCTFFLRLDLLKACKLVTPDTLSSTQALLKASLPSVSPFSMLPNFGSQDGQAKYTFNYSQAQSGPGLTPSTS